jgi:hypothetical protein
MPMRPDFNVENDRCLPAVFGLLETKTVQRHGLNIHAQLVAVGIEPLAVGRGSQAVPAMTFLDLDLSHPEQELLGVLPPTNASKP